MGRNIQPLARRVSRTPSRWFAAARDRGSARRSAELSRSGEPEERTCDGHCRQRIEVGESRPVAGQCSAIAPRGAAPSSALVACALAAHDASEALAFAAHAPSRGPTGASRAQRSPKKISHGCGPDPTASGRGSRRDSQVGCVAGERDTGATRTTARSGFETARRHGAGRSKDELARRMAAARAARARPQCGSAREGLAGGRCMDAAARVGGQVRPRRRRCPSTDGARRPRTTGSSSTCCRASWYRCRGCARRASCCRPSRRARA